MDSDWWRTEVSQVMDRATFKAQVMSEQGYIEAAVLLRKVAEDLRSVLNQEALMMAHGDGTL